MVACGEYSFVTGTGAYAEDNTRFRGLAIHFPQSRRRLGGNTAGYQQSVSVPRRANQLDAKSLNVIPRGQQSNDFNITIVARTGIDVKHPRRLL